jgi:hypothetical protein
MILELRTVGFILLVFCLVSFSQAKWKNGGKGRDPDFFQDLYDDLYGDDEERNDNSGKTETFLE